MANRTARAHVGSTAPERCFGGGGGGGAAANNGDCECAGSYAGGGGGSGRKAGGGGGKAGCGAGSSGGCGGGAGGSGGAPCAVFAAQSGHSLYAGGTSRPHCGQIHVNMYVPQSYFNAQRYRRRNTGGRRPGGRGGKNGSLRAGTWCRDSTRGCGPPLRRPRAVGCGWRPPD